MAMDARSFRCYSERIEQNHLSHAKYIRASLFEIGCYNNYYEYAATS